MDNNKRWDEGMALTWSGRWHIVVDPSTKTPRSLCGAAYLYSREKTPKHLLEDLDRGKNLPSCKHCEKAQAKKS